jgi:hypothetical protein
MAITILTKYQRDGQEVGRRVTCADAAVRRAAEKNGWKEFVRDEALARQIELKHAEYQMADPADTETRSQLADEFHALKKQYEAPIPNPVTYEVFAVELVLASLRELSIDESEVETAAEAARATAVEAAKAKAETEVVVEEIDPATI